MKAAVMYPMEEIRAIDIKPDEKGSYLKALQGLVGASSSLLMFCMESTRFCG